MTTANAMWQIPRPLLDRMEIIQCRDTRRRRRSAIARRHLLPKQMKAHGLEPEQLTFSDNAVLRVIRGYTREAGVRAAGAPAGALCRKAAREVVTGRTGAGARCTGRNVARYLGPPRYLRRGRRRGGPGRLGHGLAYTESAATFLSFEVTVLPGKGQLTLTGKLGEVMRESAQAAFQLRPVASAASWAGSDVS